MSQTAHTPGPWHTGAQNNLIVYREDGWAVANATIFHTRLEIDEAQANARLIAAAPELLEALRRIEKIINVNLWHQREKIEDARHIALEAIAKATGGQP